MRWTKPRRGGYGNVKKTSVRYKGEIITLDSKFEAQEFLRLIDLEKRGVITDLVRQPQFKLQRSFNVFTNKTKNGKSKQSNMKYTSDFQFTQGFDRVVLETKGFADKAYLMRRKMFLFRMESFGVDVFIEKTNKYTHEYRIAH